MAGHFKLGQMLLQKGLVERDQLEQALAEQALSGGRLGAVLIRLGLLAEEDLVRALAAQLQVPVARIRGKRVHPEVLDCVPVELAEKYRCLPLLLRDEPGGRVLTLALEDPSDREALSELAFQLGERLRPVLIGPAQLDDALRRHYHEPESPASSGSELQLPGTPREPEETDTQPELPPPDPLLHPTGERAAGSAPSGDDPSQDTQPDLRPGGSPGFGPLGGSPGLGSPDSAGGGPLPGASVFGASGPAASAAQQEPARPGADLGDPRLVLRALAQLLVEKGVLGREELVERLRRLALAEKRD